MKAFLIPANSSEPVREIDFDHDRSWRYVVTRYDPDDPPWFGGEVALLTKENAPRDYLIRNSRASEYVQDNLAAKDRTDCLDSPEDLYGDVVVLGYDSALEKLTDVPWRVRREDFEPFADVGQGEPPPIHVDHDDDFIEEYFRRRGAQPEAEPGLYPAPDPPVDPPGQDPYERGGAPPMW